MALIRLISALKNFFQFLYGEILKLSTYLKNWSLGPDLKTPYKQLNYKKPDLYHYKVLETGV